MNNKLLLLALIYNCTIHIASAQSVGIGTTTPVPSAMLEVRSTSKGFLPPRMDSVQRNAIVAPAAGLVIYNISIKAVQVYNGNAWYSNVHFVGERYGGGIVFHVYDNGQHGLIAALADQGTGIRWRGGTNTNTRARGNGVGAGFANTSIIIANQGPVDGNPFAATVCNEYYVWENNVTYGDWYLPSSEELNLLYLQKTIVGDFVSGGYWSSTEETSTQAIAQRFTTGVRGLEMKTALNGIRPIRAF